MPPITKGIVSAGATEIHSVRARNPCAKPLPATIPPAVNGVRSSKPRVPSRFSRAMQSAVMHGTIRQINPISKKWSRGKRNKPMKFSGTCAAWTWVT